MRIALISTYPHPLALGLRCISAYLKAHGQDVTMFFMRSKRETTEVDFSPALVADLVQRLRSAELIGISLMTGSFHRACALTEAIRRAGIKTPIIWGGTHPTVAPTESLQVADIICLGEGEQAVLQLAEALQADRDPTAVCNLAFARDGRSIRNPVRSLHEDLDALPFADFDVQTHWVAAGDRFEPGSARNLRSVLNRYRILTTRGCPYRCTFCNNAALAQLYKAKGRWVRQRSNEHVIRELEEVVGRFPTIRAVNIVDDLFFVRDAEQIAEFADLYLRRVNLPVEFDVFPTLISPPKMEALSQLPLALVSMGIQSGSPEVLRSIYNRPTPIKRIVEAIELLASHHVPAEYHYLIDNPFETDANRIETLRFIATHHRGPAVLRVFPLQFYPGTPLYHRACREGIIGPRHDRAYHGTYADKREMLGRRYLDIWLRVVLNLRNIGLSSQATHRLIDVVTHPRVRRLLDRKWFPTAAFITYSIARFIARKLIYHPLIRPLQRLASRPQGGYGVRATFNAHFRPGCHSMADYHHH